MSRAENRSTSYIDQIRRSLYWYPGFSFGGINTSNGGERDTHYRVISEFLSTNDFSHAIVYDGYALIVCYYDEDMTYVTASDWYATDKAVAFDRDYPYVRLLVKHREDNQETVEFPNAANVWCYVYNEDANQALFSKRISSILYDVSDASGDSLSNGARWFIPCRIPEKSYIEAVSILLEREDSAGVVEVWEQSADGAKYALAKSIPFSATADAPRDVTIDYYTDKGGCVSVRTDAPGVIGMERGGGYDILYTEDLSSDVLDRSALSRLHGCFNARLYAYQYQFTVEEEPEEPVFTIGEHDNVAEVITEAMKTNASTVYIEPYTHDCIREWEEFFGPGYWENLSEGWGIELENDIHIIGRSGCLLTCHYEGDNDYVQSNFSLFNNASKGSGYTIENVSFEVSRIRYVIHDERWEDDTPYMVRYSRCRMSQDNSRSSWDRSRACIGGGLGKHGDVVVEDCIFNTVTSPENMDSLAYHNGPAADAQNSLVIKNCYCEGNSTLQIESLGESELQSKVLIANNSFGSPIEEIHLDGEPGNLDIFYINNEIRSE